MKKSIKFYHLRIYTDFGFFEFFHVSIFKWDREKRLITLKCFDQIGPFVFPSPRVLSIGIEYVNQVDILRSI